MEPFILQNDSFFLIKNWIEQFPGLTAGITTKNGGVSQDHFSSLNFGFHVGDDQTSVCQNRDRLAELIDFPLDNWVGAEQTHAVFVRKISASDRGLGARSYENAFKSTDGFYTSERGILLTLCFADCVPLFFIAPKAGMIGCAHAGWKGTVHGIARNMAEAWEKEGIKASEIYAAIGPSICGKCYIVDDRVITFVENTLESVEKKPYNQIKEGQFSLDLQETNKLIMMAAGIPEQNISVTSLCSSCDQDHFYSHRRDSGKTGRMAAFIGWKEEVKP